MLRARLFTLFALLLPWCGPGLLWAASVGPAFTYQGQLKSAGAPLNGTANLQFSLWDAAGTGSPPAGGNQIGATQTISNVSVSGGLFTVLLNSGGEFGAAAFSGERRWLQISVNGTALAPRQEITPAPYALFAMNAPGASTNWLDSGDDVYLPTGNAGFGTQTPSATIHLNRPYADTGLRFQTVRFQEGPPLSAARPAGAAALGGTGQTWASPSAALASDDTRASVSLSAAVGEPDPNVSRPLNLFGFGFAIPGQAAVVGISVAIEAQGTCSCGDCDTCRVSGIVEVLGGSGGSSSAVFQFPSPETAVVTGGTFETWGLEWTPAQVNAAGFGVRLTAELSVLETLFCFPGLGCSYAPCDCAGSGTAEVDAVTMTVYYYDAAVSSSPVDWTLGIPEMTSALQISPTADFGTPVVHIDATGHVGINTTDPMHFSLAVNGFAAKPGGGTWASLSDRRLKRAIRPMAGTLDRLLSLHGYEFEYTDEAMATHLGLPGRQLGLLAQEVSQVFPDWVGRTDDGYLHVTERATTALMVEALRDLRAEKDRQLAAQAERIRSQQEEIDVLRARLKVVEDIERRLAGLEAAQSGGGRADNRDAGEEVR